MNNVIDLFTRRVRELPDPEPEQVISGEEAGLLLDLAHALDEESDPDLCRQLMRNIKHMAERWPV